MDGDGELPTDAAQYLAGAPSDEVGPFFSFNAPCSWEIDPEFPGDGRWDCPVVMFDRRGAVTNDFDSRWGTPLIVRVESIGADPRLGMFPSGGLRDFRTVAPCPSAGDLCLVADGLAYVVQVDHPDRGAFIVSDRVLQIVAMPEPPLLLFARFSDVLALGEHGVAWRSKRVVVDDIFITQASAAGIICVGENLGGSPTISLDPATGEQTSGTTMRDLGWPPP